MLRRREFIALAAAGAGLPLGFSLYGMKGVPWRKAVGTLSSLGYKAVEAAMMAGYEVPVAEYGAFKRALRESGMVMAGVMDNLQLLGAAHAENLERLKRARDAAAEMGGDVVESIIGGKPGEFETTKQAMVERLGEWGRVFEGSKVKLAVKAHVMQAVQKPLQLAWLLDQVPGVKAAYDYSHFAAQGMEMAESVRAVAGRTVFVHIKDVAAEKPVRFLLPGEGTIDYRALSATLLSEGVKTPVVVEVSAQIHNQAGYDAVRAATICRDKLCGAFSCVTR